LWHKKALGSFRSLSFGFKLMHLIFKFYSSLISLFFYRILALRLHLSSIYTNPIYGIFEKAMPHRTELAICVLRIECQCNFKTLDLTSSTIHGALYYKTSKSRNYCGRVIAGSSLQSLPT